MNNWGKKLFKNFFYTYYVAVFFYCYAQIGCSKSNTPPDNVDTLTVLVPGLGASQLDNLRIKDSVVVNEWDGYKTDLIEFLKNVKYSHLILIGHSYGCNTVLNDAIKFPNLIKIVLIDPVAEEGNELNIITAVPINLFYRSELIGPVTAKIYNDGIQLTGQIVKGSHNTIPHTIPLAELLK